MSKPKYLYVSDLDGTLLRSDVTLSEWSKQQLIRLLSSGFPFTIATGRNITSVREILHDIPLHLPVVGGNGTYISDFKTGKHIMLHNISIDIAKDVFSLIYTKGLMPFVSTYTDNQDRLYYENIRNQGSQLFLEERLQVKDPRLHQLPVLESCLKEALLCITLIDEKSVLTELKIELEEQFPNMLEIHLYDNLSTPGWYWMSIHDCSATKANGIQKIAHELGYEMIDVTVFGDQTNDISMFQQAGRSIAVENAIPELKMHATHTIGHHEEDSVIQFLLKDIEANK